MPNPAMLTTENPEWGFYGTMQRAGFDPDAAWRAALPIVAGFWCAAHPRIAAKRARLFLDSSGGRHLANTIPTGTNDIAGAVSRVLPAFYGWLH